MPRPHPHPDRDQDRFWPSCDDQQPGVSIRPLTHADLAALLTHLDHGHDPGDTRTSEIPAPVLARRVRASVGRPGASAHAQYRGRRAAELAAWTHSLPWRIAAVLAVGLAAWLLATQVVSHLSALAGAIVAAGLAWRLRFRVTPDILAWRRGAAGERRTARLLGPLERRGWAVLHDLAIPGTQANIDHLVIGPGGVVVIDTKQYRGRLWLDADGLLWRGRHLVLAALRKVRWAADQADDVLGVVDVQILDVQILAIMAVHGAQVPWGQLTVDGVIIAPARRMPDLLEALPAILGPERVAWLADRARLRFHAAA
jgi:hypothetical protein